MRAADRIKELTEANEAFAKRQAWWNDRMFQLEQAREIAALRAALLDARDCRTCRHFTRSSGGCVSVLRCIDGSSYQRLGRIQYWEAAPLDPAQRSNDE
jgi:hypothetical protein